MQLLVSPLAVIFHEISPISAMYPSLSSSLSKSSCIIFHVQQTLFVLYRVRRVSIISFVVHRCWPFLIFHIQLQLGFSFDAIILNYVYYFLFV